MKKLLSKIARKILPNSIIFSTIYKKNKWGGEKGEFFSGAGSYNPNIDGYVNIIVAFIIEKKIKKIVEIGCGDFFVTNKILSHLKDQDYSFTYTGYDVVESLIERNNKVFSSANIQFICNNPSKDNTVFGELLLIRQVLQHLSNKRIKRIVDTFNKYKYIIVTEHQPSSEYGTKIIPNIDQSTGGGIRTKNLSGVYLEKEPFNCQIDSLLYSFPENADGLNLFINTYLINNEPKQLIAQSQLFEGYTGNILKIIFTEN